MGGCLCACLPASWGAFQFLRPPRSRSVTATATSTACTPSPLSLFISSMQQRRPLAAPLAAPSTCSERPLDALLPSDCRAVSLVAAVLANIRAMVNVDQEAPRALLLLHEIAERNEAGWQRVLVALLETVPLADPLGPAAILLVLEDAPLPTRDAVTALTVALGLSADFASRHAVAEPQLMRNICVALGCLADKMPGAQAVALLTDSVLAYLLRLLIEPTHALVKLFAVIALEKLAQTLENKLKIADCLRCQSPNPLLLLENDPSAAPSSSEPGCDFDQQQLRLCVQWCLDNVFLVDGRSYTYTGVDYTRINVMLNSEQAAARLKVAPDGLQARCDTCSFDSVRATLSVSSGCWYYEATLVTAGVMQIGWASSASRFVSYDGFGVGDDALSVGYDGCRRLLWHKARPQELQHRAWRAGDTLGALLDLPRRQCLFYLNGDPLPPFTDLFTDPAAAVAGSSGFYPAASFMSFQQCRFNFGLTPFCYPPADRPFSCFNDHPDFNSDSDSDSDQQQQQQRGRRGQLRVLPRPVLLAQLAECAVGDDVCSLCYDRPHCTALAPCGHAGFCAECASNLLLCPYCRVPIDERISHPPPSTIRH